MLAPELEIESSRGMRLFGKVLGLALAGTFAVGFILATLQSGPNPVLLIISLFPIGLGIAAFLWMGRPAWIRVGTNAIWFVPPLGSGKEVPKSSVKWIVRVPGGRGTSTIEFRDELNRNLLVIEQGFSKIDIEKLAEYVGAKFTWELEWENAIPAGKGG